VARTRAQRRRHTLLITLALVVTFGFLVFGRDVSRSAHNASAPRRSEDRSFAALANTLITSENSFDGRLHRLLAQGGTLRRSVFDARLNQLAQQLSGWQISADQLARPKLAHHINDTLNDLTQQRVDDYETLLGNIASALKLPWSQSAGVAVVNPAASLVATSKQWNVDRFALVREPGRVHLHKTSSLAAAYFVTNGTSALAQAPSLVLVRAIGIGALRVTPAPLPAVTGVLLLPPVTSVKLGVSVVNMGYDYQPVKITVRVTPLNARGAAFVQSMTTVLGPLQAYAFVPKSFRTTASEQARVQLILTGAPGAAGMVTQETYRLEMSPS